MPVTRLVSLPEKSFITIFNFLLRTKTTKVVVFRVGIEQPQNYFVTFSVSYVVALNITSDLDLVLSSQSRSSPAFGDSGVF